MTPIQTSTLLCLLLLTGCSHNDHSSSTVMPSNQQAMIIKSGYSVTKQQAAIKEQKPVQLLPEPSTDVPAPAGILGSVFAWSYARRLRRRIKEAQK